MATDRAVTRPAISSGQWGGASAPPPARSVARAWMILATAAVVIGLTAVVATVA